MAGAVAPVDIPVQVKGLSDLEKLTKRMEALEKEVTRLQGKLPKAANGIAQTGRAAKGAAGGVQALGSSFKAALGPIGAALSAIGGLTAAFNVLKSQDFAQAKFQSLGGNAQQLVVNLQAVSNELKGQRSVAELTGAAYDVASAGFSSAAEASLVLKAASQGAAGGFSDLNTVGNATTSVLNAYKLSAADATRVVDQFIQTQNDGKIIVAEYAANIGKVASAAAGLGIPLSEVNAVIAQSTAAGVQAEVAFTGLKGALARLATGEASKAIEETGIKINAATLKSDGLYKTLKKLEGLDTGQIFAALGTEAGPALLPVIQNLEKYEELLKNQEKANGVAAQAAATAAGTIEGAWKRVTVALQNLFSDQTELGQIIRATLLAAAATVEAFGAAFKIVVAPVRAVIEAITRIASAMTGVKDAESVLTSFTSLWFDAIAAVEDTANTITAVGVVVGDRIGGLITTVIGWFSGLWSSINSGVQSVIPSITGAFSSAFQQAKNIIMSFWNSLPGWLKAALNAAGNVAGAVVGAVKNALGGVVKDIQTAKAQVEISVPKGGNVSIPDIAVPTGGGIAGGGSGGGGGGGADKAAREAERLAKKTQEQLKASEELRINADNRLLIAKAINEQDKIELEGMVKKDEIERKYTELLSKQLSDAEQTNLLAAKGLEIELATLETAEALKDLRESAVGSINDEIELLQAKLNGTEKELMMRREIAALTENGSVSPAEAQRLVETKAALEKQFEAQEKTKASAEALAGAIAGALTDSLRGLIDGSKTAEEALSDAFKGIADSFLQMAMQMIQEWLKMQAIGLVSGLFTGGATSGGSPLLGNSLSSFGGGTFAGFADGGRPTPGKLSIVGEEGPELFLPDTSGTVIPNDAFADARGAMGGTNGGGGSEDGGLDSDSVIRSFSENSNSITMTNSYMRERAMERESREVMGGAGSMVIETQVINNVEYASVEQVQALSAAAAKQARAQVFSDMKNKPSRRAMVGLK